MLRNLLLWVMAGILGCSVASAAPELEADLSHLKPHPLLSELSEKQVKQYERFQELALQPMHLTGTRRGPHYTEITREERQKRIKRYTTDPEGKQEFARLREQADQILAGRARGIEALEWTYIVTREQKYFDYWRQELLAELNCCNAKFPKAFDMGTTFGNGTIFIWGRAGVPEFRLLTARSYDLMCEYLSKEDEQQFRWQLKKYCDALRLWKVDRNNITGQGEGGNMAALTIGKTPLWFAIGYDEVIDWAISHVPVPLGRDPGGMLELTRFGRDNGYIWGEALIYQWYVCTGYAALIERAARYDGRDVWNMVAPDTGNKPRNFVDGIAAMSFPAERTGVGQGSIRIANYGEEGTSLWQDQWLNYGGAERANWQEIFASVYEATNDAGFGWLANIHQNKEDMPAGVAPPAAPSWIFPTSGIAMLRADELPEYWMGRGLAMQVMGGEPRRSAPGDSFSMRLHGAGRFLYPDWIMTYYEVYNDVGWERSGMRRNSALIDGRDTWRHRTFWRSDFAPEVKYLSLRASRYGHEISERAFMMTNEYLLDIFDMVVHDRIVPVAAFYGDAGKVVQYAGWSGAGLTDEAGKMPESHTFDYVLHGIGQQFPSQWQRYSPSNEMTNERWSNRWLTNEKRADMKNQGFYVDWIQRSGGNERRYGMYQNLGREWFEDQAAVRMHMLGSPGTTAYTLEAPMGDGGHHTERKVPNPPSNVVDPDENPEMTIKTLIVRRRGKDAQFAALHEPFNDRPAIKRFEYLHKPKADDANRTVGMKVTGPDYVDRLYLTLGLYGMFKDAGGGTAEEKEGKREVKNYTLDWRFKKDPDEVGVQEKWFDTTLDRSAWRKVDAGVDWQDFERGYYGAAWYAKTLEPIDLPAGKKVHLLFEGIDEDCWVYLDGKLIHERIARPFGSAWDVPILLDVTAVFSPGVQHHFAIKVRKMKYQTGIYAPVRLLVEAPERGPQPDPVVTVTAKNDPNESITFKGQAYVRESGDALLARGKISGFCIRAPQARSLTLNGEKAQVRRVGEYALYGKAADPAAKAREAVADAATVAPAPASFPLEAGLPQEYINIDAAKGGTVIVRVTNRSDQTMSGRVSIVPGDGLKAKVQRREFTGLPPAHRIDLGFKLAAGAKPGSLVPLEVAVAPLRMAVAEYVGHRVSAKVAVGVVVEEIPATYLLQQYGYDGGMPGKLKPKKDWLVRPFDYIQVRAPGYTLRIDKFSGRSRWIMDPTGLVRTSLAGYPYGMTRVAAKEWRYRPQETISGGSWIAEAKYLGVSSNPDGNPVLKFSSTDGKQNWQYVLTPEKADGVAAGNLDVPGVAAPNGLGFKLPEGPWWQEKAVSIWPAYPLDPPRRKTEQSKQEGKNLVAGLKASLQLPDKIKATGGVYWDEAQKVGGVPSLCFDLDKLRGIPANQSLRVQLPVTIIKGKRYRFVISMRHENVAGIPEGEWTYTASPFGTVWQGIELGKAGFWPNPVREWFAACDVVKPAKNSVPMYLNIKVPSKPQQTGKYWLGGFILEEVN